jgi:hypothetical protein
MYEGRGDAYRVLMVKHKGEKQLGRPCLRWRGNIKMELLEVG